MILVIDGYNVIHRARLAMSESLEKQRDELIRLSALHRQKKNVQIVIFFDNKTNTEFLESPSHPSLEIFFSESADDAIIEFISESQKPSEMEVATDDKSLRDRAKHHGASWISVDELMHRFCPESRRKPMTPRKASQKQFASEKPANFFDHNQINKTLPWG